MAMTALDDTGWSRSAQHVLASLIAERQATRPDLARLTGLSKPTVAAAMAELETAGLVESAETVRGALGRAPLLYQLGSQAGWVLGVDYGSTHARAVAKTLDDAILAEATYDPGLRRAASTGALVPETARMVSTLVADLRETHGPLRAAGLAVGRRVPAEVAQEGTAALHPELGELIEAIRVPQGTPLLVENNVNCAALGELGYGAARDLDDFVYLQLGVRVGSGVVIRRSLVRGIHGGAGEVRFVPPPGGAGDPTRVAAFEKWLGAPALLQRVRINWPKSEGTPPHDTADLFERAKNQKSAAHRSVRTFADDVGRLAATLISVLDPQAIVLGGGVGGNPLLAPHVQRSARRYTPYANVLVSELGDDATLQGATLLALDHALKTLLGQFHEPLFPDTPIVAAGPAAVAESR